MLYDLIIVGSGPAGLTAALFAARYKLKTLIIGKELGGQANYAHEIENYPGFSSISGRELINKFKENLSPFKIRLVEDEVKHIEKTKDIFTILTSKNKYTSSSLILALGTERKKLNLPEEEKFIGRGISYCSTCDSPLFKNKIVAVIGGNNSAAMSALLLVKYAKKVYIIYRSSQLRADAVLLDKVKKEKNISVIYNAEVNNISGKSFVESIHLTNKKILEVQGIFVEIGSTPSIYLTKKLGLRTDVQGYIAVNNEMKTNIQGIFAAGDCVLKKLRQIVNACGEGAVAVFSANSYLKSKK